MCFPKHWVNDNVRSAEPLFLYSLQASQVRIGPTATKYCPSKTIIVTIKFGQAPACDQCRL